MTEPIITREVVEEGERAYAKFRQHLAGDIWDIPSVRDYERWEGDHAEAACAALVELLELTNYRNDTNQPDGPYSRGFRDACQFIARSIFGEEPVPGMGTAILEAARDE